MRTLFRSCMATVMALTAVACAKTDALEVGAETVTEGQPLTFAISGINATGVTRAIASPEEYGVDELQIFMFDYTAETPGTGLLRGIFPIDIADLKAAGQHLTADLGILAPEDYGTDDKIYYFVANGQGIESITESATGLVVFDGSTNAATATKEEDFVNALTATLGDAALAMERPLLFSGRSARWGLNGATSANLRRRAARFDIVNEIPEDFIIKKIEIETPAANAYIFAENDRNASRLVHSTATYNLTESTYGKAFNAPASYVEKAGANGMEFICESAFYLYPTSVPTQTTITITADYDGTTDRQFYINQTMQILPNSRYKLVASPDRMMFMLVLADWEEGEESPVARIGALEIENLAIAPGGTGTGILNSEAYQVKDGDDLILTFDVTCASNRGVVVTPPDNIPTSMWAYLTPGAVSTTPTRANGAAYRQSFTLEVGYFPQDDTPFEVVYHFTDAVDSRSMGTLVLWNAITPAISAVSSNSYMVAPVSKAIYIPVDRGVSAGYNTMLPSDAIDAEFLWTDVSGGKTVIAPVKAVTALGRGTGGYLRVEPGTIQGNALVAVSVNDVIKWSWHIWNTAYYPYDASGNAEGTAASGGKWMDRNLGAINATPGDIKASRLYYQWGRKDPFIGNSVPKYDMRGATGPIVFKPKPTGTDMLSYAIENPSVYITSDLYPSYDWMDVLNNNLWKDNVKTIFDPCPDGYKIPKLTDWGDRNIDDWGGVISGPGRTLESLNYGRTNDTYGGYYPAAGGYNYEGIFGSAYTSAILWVTNPGSYTLDDGAHDARYINMGTTQIQNNPTARRDTAYAVRCIAE